MKVYFLGNGRCFHTLDWYRSIEKQILPADLFFITDLIESEGQKKLLTEKDNIYHLFNIDNLLPSYQSNLIHKYRNMLKLLLLPIQIIKLKLITKKYNIDKVIAHTMYYMFLARAAGIKYTGTPQGSEILVRPYRSKFYFYFAKYAINGATHVTVDSNAMVQKINELYSYKATLLQNGIDIASIKKKLKECSNLKTINLSIRGMHPIYQIKELVQARNKQAPEIKLTFIYPFHNIEYKDQVVSLLNPIDDDQGRLDKSEMLELLSNTKIVFSIPTSDSSPKSIYESIFMECFVIATKNDYYYMLSENMKQRMIIIDLKENNWLSNALQMIEYKINNCSSFTNSDYDKFDQLITSKTLLNLYLSINKNK